MPGNRSRDMPSDRPPFNGTTFRERVSDGAHQGRASDATKRIVWMASEYGRYGYRHRTALLRAEGRRVNRKRVERIWPRRA